MAIERQEFDAWLAESCRRQGVPLRVADPAALSAVRILLSGGVPAGEPRVRGVPRAPAESEAPDGFDSGQIVA